MPKIVKSAEKMRTKSFKLHPKTIEMIERIAKEKGITQAELLDTSVKMLFLEGARMED